MTRPLRVLHIIPSVSPQRGGPSGAIISMVRALHRLGIEAEIATTDDDGPGTLAVPLNRPSLFHGVTTNFFRRTSFPLRALRDFAWAPAFPRWLRQHAHEYDLLHVHALFSHLPTSAMRIARARGVPYINRPLGLLGRWPLQQSFWRKRLYLGALERANLQAAGAIHFTSEMEREEASDLRLGRREVVIPHGDDLPPPLPQAGEELRAALGLAREAKIILFLGRLHPKKGVDLLLSAFARLRDATAVLLIAGEGEALPDLKRQMHRQHLDGRVHFAGFVRGERKQLLLAGADLFALTSKHENFGCSVLEALAAGTRVLVSDRVALASEVKRFDLGRVCTLKVDSISECLTGLLEHEADLSRGRLRSFVAERYTWDATAAELAKLYASTITASAANNKRAWSACTAAM